MTDASYREAELVLIDYTNHAGVRQVRTIAPITIRFDSSQWHPEQQWLLDAYDVGKSAMRTFAVASINRWGVHPDRQMDVDLSIARQLQRSMELNARMKVRLRWLQDWAPIDVNQAIASILADQEPQR